MKSSKSQSSLKRAMVLTTVLTSIIIAVAAISFTAARKDEEPTTADTSETSVALVDEAPEETDSDAVISQAASQEDMLLYLIEEEKLAHDVYTVMYQTYGSKVFGNILNSEQTHQNKVLTLLQSRNIADPRSTDIGVFTNPALQQLYDTLIAQGKQSVSEAYTVGKAIEEKDIADITKQLATASDSDIVSTLNALRDGSENHLRAFNRQLGRY
jgi:hypothetical protein